MTEVLHLQDHVCGTFRHCTKRIQEYFVPTKHCYAFVAVVFNAPCACTYSLVHAPVLPRHRVASPSDELNVIFSPTAIPNGSFSLLLLLPGLAKFFPIPVPVPLATPIPSRCHCQSHTTETKRFLARAYVTARYYCLSVCPSHS